MTMGNGDVYVGEWEAGKQHGRGALFAAKGRVYDGQWVEGKAQGAGVHRRAKAGSISRNVLGVWKATEGEGEEDTLSEVELRVLERMLTYSDVC